MSSSRSLGICWLSCSCSWLRSRDFVAGTQHGLPIPAAVPVINEGKTWACLDVMLIWQHVHPPARWIAGPPPLENRGSPEGSSGTDAARLPRWPPHGLHIPCSLAATPGYALRTTTHRSL